MSGTRIVGALKPSSRRCPRGCASARRASANILWLAQTDLGEEVGRYLRLPVEPAEG